ncbi:hypothetical protein Tco_0586822, partial [Tanacetum coccineum]
MWESILTTNVFVNIESKGEKAGTPKKNKIVFTTPTKEEITTKKHLVTKTGPPPPPETQPVKEHAKRSALKNEKKDKKPEGTLEKEKAEGKDA